MRDRMTTMRMIIMTMPMIIMRMITNRRPNNFITNKQSDRFPEIPESTLRRLTRLRDDSPNPGKDQTEQQNNNLQNHEL